MATPNEPNRHTGDHARSPAHPANSRLDTEYCCHTAHSRRLYAISNPPIIYIMSSNGLAAGSHESIPLTAHLTSCGRAVTGSPRGVGSICGRSSYGPGSACVADQLVIREHPRPRVVSIVAAQRVRDCARGHLRSEKRAATLQDRGVDAVSAPSYLLNDRSDQRA